MAKKTTTNKEEERNETDTNKDYIIWFYWRTYHIIVDMDSSTLASTSFQGQVRDEIYHLSDRDSCVGLHR